MKEFDKKSSPSREGFSKFLPASMSDSSTRRRLTEYEIQVQDLQAYIRSLEAETVHLRKKLEDTPKDFMVLENKLREANRQLVQAFNQNEKLVNALYEAREQTSMRASVVLYVEPTIRATRFDDRVRRRSGTELADLFRWRRWVGDGVARGPAQWGKTQKIQHVNRR